MDYQKILVAVDDSSNSMKAARAGFAIARRLKATVGLVFVINKSNEIFNTELGITTEQSKTVLIKEAETAIDQYIRMYDGTDEVFRFMPEGLPEKEILNIASEWKADMIVMGTHCRTGISRILSGSLSDYIVRHAEIPVLIIPPGLKSN
jgi:nucleotide-binding universal stress UspA family protein